MFTCFEFPLPSLLVVATELFERMGFYVISITKGTFLTQRLGFDKAMSIQLSSLFGSSIYLYCLVGGVVADSCLGRYRTIASFAVLYSFGMSVAATATIPILTSSILFVVGVFLLVPLASGGIKPVVSTFAADQVEIEDHAKADKVKGRIYSAFYVITMLGAAISSGFLCNIATTPQSFGISEDWGYFVAYMVAAIGMVIGTTIFCLGAPLYNTRQVVKASPTGDLVRAVVYSGRKSVRGAICLFGWLLTLPYMVLYIQQGLSADTTLAWLALVLYVVQFACLIWAHSDNSFLELPDRDGYDDQDHDLDRITIEEVRLTFQAIPLMLTVSFTWYFMWRLSSQYYYHQVCQMDVHFFGGQINGSIMYLANNLAVIIAMPVVEACFYPCIARLRGQVHVSVQAKLVMGVMVTALGVGSAAILEWARHASPIIHPPGWTPEASLQVRFPDLTNFADLHLVSLVEPLMGQCVVDGIDYCSNCAPKCPAQTCGATMGIYMSQLSMWWMVIPYFLEGIAEIMVVPVLQYLAYSFAPPKARTLTQALVLTFTGVYPLASTSILTTMFKTAIPDDLNRGMALGFNIGIEIFYIIPILFALPAVPAILCVNRHAPLVDPEVALDIAKVQEKKTDDSEEDDDDDDSDVEL